jgi:ribosomal protein S18 acetylase RimI-like enzyme
VTTTIDVRTVRPTDAADHQAVVTALSRGFYDDPVFRWIYPDDNRRLAVLPGFFAVFATAIGRHEVSLVAGEGIGAALWVPPGGQVVADDEAEAFGEALATLSPPDVERVVTCMSLLEETHPHERCWYLNLVGVDPQHQGRGIGSALLRPVLDRCDADGEGAYLEATSGDNRRLYERHGFETVRELPLPGGPSLWAMWRNPRTG